jgi:hypothetical protein
MDRLPLENRIKRLERAVVCLSRNMGMCNIECREALNEIVEEIDNEQVGTGDRGTEEVAEG